MLAAAACVAGPLVAQCPDGTPPPCAHAARRAPPSPAERGRRFLILPFRNISRASEHAWLVEGATTMLGDALGRWQEIRVVPDEQLYPALRRHGLVPGVVMDQARVRGVAEETGGWTAVTGEILATGGHVRVSARAVDVVTNRELVRATRNVSADGDVRAAFEQIGTSLLRAAGLDSATVDLAAATTRSLDAYRAYLRGVALFHRSLYRQARDAFLESVRLDSTFAQAYVLLAQSEVFISPLSLFDAQNAAQRHAARAADLALRLPPAQREIALATHDMLQGQVTSARGRLERLVAADSSDFGAMGLLALMEWADPILIPAGAGERPRGSLNRSNRLVRRILELNPDNHASYLPLVVSHAYAGGDLPGLLIGVRHEGASLREMMLGGNPRLFVPVYTDSILLIPVESLGTWSADSLAAARQRGLGLARSWAERWLAVGPGEGEAHLALARVLHRQGELARALAELRVADSLGVESGVSMPAFLRLTVLATLGRYDEAGARADALGAIGAFDSIMPLPTEATEALAWAFNLHLMHGDFGRAEAMVDGLAAALRRAGFPALLTAGIALPLASGARVPPLWLLELPVGFRADVMDSVYARRSQIPAGSHLERDVTTLQHLVGSADADSTTRARVRAAPWYHPTP